MLIADSSVISILLWILIVFISFVFYWLIIQRIIKHYIHFPIPSFAVRFIDNPVRRRFQPPEKVVDWIDIRDGMRVLEIGPGPGTFTFEAVKRASGHGSLVALDIQSDVIVRLDKRFHERRLPNASAIVASAQELPFSDGVFDRVFMIGVLGEIPDKQRALVEIKRVLKSDGLLAVGELLPDPDYPLRKTVINWCRNVGLSFTDSHGSMLHYLLKFRKS
jgi:ubiquinone/menaquinone biosynthesis C-methylase UbiE